MNVSKSGHTLKLSGFTDKGKFDGTKVEVDGVIILVTKDGKTYETKDVYVSKDVVTKFEKYVKAGKVVN